MLVETNDGLLSELSSLGAGWLRTLRAGLFTGELVPTRSSTIGDVEPCTFSGYVGPRDLVSWGTPSLVGWRAIIEHGYFLFRHNGGPITEAVQGYYVIDRDGVLCWAELRPVDAVIMSTAGQTYRLLPRYSLRSEFGGI